MRFAVVALLDTWVQAFALTQGVELPIYALLLPGSVRERVLGGALPSAVTHPVLWFGLPPLVAGLPVCADAFVNGGACWWAWVAAAELGVVAVEAGVLWALGAASPARALALAALANTASFVAGEALRAAATGLGQ